MKTTTYFLSVQKLLSILAIFFLPLLISFQTQAQCGNDPEFVTFFNSPACGSVIQATVGQLTIFDIFTSDGDNNNEHITWSSGTLPNGATTSPPLPENDNPPGGAFIWTPTAADVGSHIIDFAVTDICGTEVTCSFTINVVNACANAPAFISQFPACGSTISATAGVPLSYTLNAYELDSGDVVTLSASGLPSGASMSPAFPTSGNPASSNFSWTPGPGDAGLHTVTFQATDGCQNKTFCTHTIDVAGAVSNDLCANAISISCGDTIPGTTDNASPDIGSFPPCATAVVNAPGVWYTFVGNGDVAKLSLSNCTTSNIDLNVFSGTCNSLTCRIGSAVPCSGEINFVTVPGVTYFVLVSTDDPDLSGSFNILLNCVAPLPNDDCANAIPLTCGSTTTGTTIGGTTEISVNGVPNCFVQGIASIGVWYSFVGAGSDITLSTCTGTDFDSRMRVFTGSCSSNLLCAAGRDNTCGVNEDLTFHAAAGTNYLILIDGASIGLTGNFTLTLSCSSQQPCAIDIVEIQNIGSCNDNGTNDPSDDYFISDVGVSYINPPATGNLEIKLPGDVVAGGGATSIAVANIGAGQHVFTGIRFKADGTATVVEAGFTADPLCTKVKGGPTVQPCSTPVTCDPAITDDNNPCTIDACDPATGNVTHTPVTLTAPFIVGQTIICTNTQGIYTAVGSIDALFYTWTVPKGVTILSGQGTATLTVKFTTSCQSGSICVTASNNCGNASPACIYINAISRTPVLGAITGQANAVCAGGNFQYCIPPVIGVTNYTWINPVNTQIIAGQGTNCITLNIIPGFTTGKISVTAQNCKGTSAIKSLQLKNLPPTPGVISGPSSNLCLKTEVVYSIAAIANTTSYLWTVPPGATIVLGQGTNTIKVDFVTPNSSGNISVKGVNACGNGPARNLAVKSIPPATSAINGSASVCKNQQQVAYSVTAVPGIIYNWTLPSGASVTTGQGTANITVKWGTTSGNVKVIPSNACGNGPSKTKAVSINNCTRNEGSTLNEEELILVYPNPADDFFTIEFEAASPSTEIIEVRNIIGEVVYADQVNTVAGKNIKYLPVENLSSGMYIITVKGSVNKYTRISVE